MHGDYQAFPGLDVDKGDHHAVGLAPDGGRLPDAPLPNTESGCLSCSTNSRLPARQE
ncbi:hypothetical protein H4W31_005663 [Plantactinospora soyae]|uniref:Uncharacterized protein n=1 Tax=Plantactinospora soyae TaxID=1544732 RepID=A0A927MAK2_9ACTN|nr:hypothetical protein [Plantactinospora soyae]